MGKREMGSVPVREAGVPGEVTLDPGCVETIVGLAALNAYGIVAMGKGRVAQKFSEGRLGRALSSQAKSRGVYVAVEDGRVSVELYVVIERGLNIREVCRNLRSRVAYAVESMTGYVVDRVDIHVQGVRAHD
ncbi:Asp23/Gls24 family envelope stress response protein [Rubrobacter taiwanensis]|uniref:Asp23/Gls24 family envelope stress response protein n=1 Tax=Rubrobacter taiwanensis TaxID=185139 RepID=A0A4R1BHA9_9ACTN|nr:Asp23/Gls24 family envelope stress response protein [Rubrobacter taiwanensis]TCJ16665.1 Asp23/Gls24 family envelope stress response protein [Rubrobacter taiwanensis]